MNPIVRRALTIDGQGQLPALMDAAFAEDESCRWETVATTTLQEALARLHVDGFDLVLADLALPDSPALPTLLRLTELVVRTPIVVVGDAPDHSIRSRALREGVQDVLPASGLPAAQLRERIENAIERKDADEQVHAGMIKVHHNDRMEAIGRLAGGFAHDFNNILTSIHGYTTLLMDGLEAESEAAQDAGEVLKGVERGTELTRKLSTFSRREDFVPVEINLNDVVQDARRMLARLLGDAIELIAEPAAGVHAAVLDRGSVEQVLVQLILNAREAMPDGGRVHVAVSNEDLSSHALVGHPDVEPGQYVLLEVTDTGPGIDEAVRLQIFEPFFTLKGKSGGPGLGLSTVHGIVRHFHGHVLVYSEPQHGTTFKVLFPAVHPTAATSDPEVSGQPRTILVVEDDADVMGLARTFLERDGHEVLTAKNGAEALAIAKAHDGPIHATLCDVVLPDANGPDVVERVMAQRPDLRVVYTSAYSRDVIHDRGMIPRGSLFLSKPIAAEPLRRTLQEAFSGPTT